MGPIQSILVHVDAGPHGAARLRAARTLGAHLGASISALYAVAPVYVEVANGFAAAGAEQALRAIDAGRVAAARGQVARVNAERGAPVEWREAGEPAEYAFIREALYADLLVFGQHDPEHDSGVRADFVPSVLLASGKPALVVPCIGDDALAIDTVLVAWKESREAAHALTAALPILRAAGVVHVAVDATVPEANRALLERLLRRHGVEARWHAFNAEAALAGELLLSLAADLDADLMVMGCYGHSRAREFVLGGASRSVLRSMTLPVLMSH